MLSRQEEYTLAKRWVEHQDKEAAARLVNSHLRLVAKIARGYRGYGLPVADLISEGNLGLMHGVNKFDPERGFRLATYAVWWIRASIQDYILRSWSIVKIGTTAGQKRLFFNLRRMKSRINTYADGALRLEDVETIASELGVTEEEASSMNGRMAMGGDASLNVPIGEQRDGQWQDWLVDPEPLQDERVAEAQETARRHELLEEAMQALNERDKHILAERRLSDRPKTLDELSRVYDLSRERIRQIELAAFDKLRKAMIRLARERGLPPAGPAAL